MSMKIPFGFNTINVENQFTFYTGKMIVKNESLVIKEEHSDIKYYENDNYTLITFITTDKRMNSLFIQGIKACVEREELLASL
jgi:hypothetical protein